MMFPSDNFSSVCFQIGISSKLYIIYMNPKSDTQFFINFFFEKSKLQLKDDPRSFKININK